MMIYRALVVGLLGAVVLLMASQTSAIVRALEHADRAPAPMVVAAPPLGLDDEGPATIVHISRRLAGDDPADALGLGRREEVTAIDGRPVPAPFGRQLLRARWAQSDAGRWFEVDLRGARARHLVVLVMK